MHVERGIESDRVEGLQTYGKILVRRQVDRNPINIKGIPHGRRGQTVLGLKNGRRIYGSRSNASQSATSGNLHRGQREVGLAGNREFQNRIVVEIDDVSFAQTESGNHRHSKNVKSLRRRKYPRGRHIAGQLVGASNVVEVLPSLGSGSSDLLTVEKRLANKFQGGLALFVFYQSARSRHSTHVFSPI